MANKTRDVTIIEVGPRDGLQNEPKFVSTSTKIELINALSETGLPHIEVTSFVNPKRIPQLSDNLDVYQRIYKKPGVIYSALVPNIQGMKLAIQANIQTISIFTAASETFNQRNIACSIAESIERFHPVIEQAKTLNIPIRAYISCVLGCPYEGKISPSKVLKVVERLLELNVQEISFGDTIGVGTPKQTAELLKTIQPQLDNNKICMHFHDTYGQAVANVYTALEHGIKKFDSSLAGLGGCPYARGASGNVATEDLLYLMHGMGLETGVDIYQIVQLGDKICQILQRQNQSKVAKALLAEH